MSELDLVIQCWQAEVDAETVSLITAGTPPKFAEELARGIVMARRRDENVDGNKQRSRNT